MTTVQTNTIANKNIGKFKENLNSSNNNNNKNQKINNKLKNGNTNINNTNNTNNNILKSNNKHINSDNNNLIINSNIKKNQFYTFDKEGKQILSVKMPKKRKDKLTNEIFLASSLQARGNIVAITNYKGERYSGVFTKLEERDEGVYVIHLQYAQRIGLEQPLNERSNHTFTPSMQISTDELRHLEVKY